MLPEKAFNQRLFEISSQTESKGKFTNECKFSQEIVLYKDIFDRPKLFQPNDLLSFAYHHTPQVLNLLF